MRSPIGNQLPRMIGLRGQIHDMPGVRVYLTWLLDTARGAREQ